MDWPMRDSHIRATSNQCAQRRTVNRWYGMVQESDGKPKVKDNGHTVTAHSDALVLFGVTGDLAYKKILPALYAMVRIRYPDRSRDWCGVVQMDR